MTQTEELGYLLNGQARFNRGLWRMLLIIRNELMQNAFPNTLFSWYILLSFFISLSTFVPHLPFLFHFLFLLFLVNETLVNEEGLGWI